MPHIKFKKIEKAVLICIIIFVFFLFVYKLSSNPPGLYLDEVGTGYNAYSILKTGKDEYGKVFPVAFRLFGSYTPAMYIYLSVPVMAIFGLSVFSTRLLSVICGLIAIVVVFYIIKNLKITKSKYTPLVSILFFAITPWFVMYSRIGYEQNLAFLFFCFSSLSVLLSLRNPKLLAIALPIISLATHADYAQRLVAPLLFIGIFIIFRKKLLQKKYLKYIVIGSAIAFLIQIPNFFMLTTQSFYTKTEHFYFDVIASQSQKISHFLPDFLAVPLAFIREFSSKFLTFFSPRSLFFFPDSDPQRSMPALSNFYHWMVIPYLIGFFIVGKTIRKESSKFILLLLLISPLPGALTHEPFHIQRTISLLLPLSLLITIGIDKLIYKKKLIYWLSITMLLFFGSLILLWRSYFILLPQERAEIWGSHYEKLAEYIEQNPDQTFVIDQGERTGPKDIAYIQMAFYLKADPKLLQQDQDPRVVEDYYNFVDYSFVHKFSNIETRAIDWGEAENLELILVGDRVSISDDEVQKHRLTQVFEFRDPNEQVIMRGFKTNPRN